MTIDPVDRENDQDSIVQCVASQVFDDLGYTNVEVRKVSIDVWCRLQIVAVNMIRPRDGRQSGG